MEVPTLPPSSDTIQTLIESSQNEQVHSYQPYKGIPELRNAMKNWYQMFYQVDLNADTEILPLIGSKEGITHISLAFLKPEDEVLVPQPGYPAYKAVTEMVGAKPRFYSLKEEENWQPHWEAMESEDLANVKLMWLNYPNMPTGTPPSTELFEKAVSFAKKHNILLCHDNPYSLILNQTDPISILSVPGAKEVAIELSSMSKNHNMAGWRVGWISGGAGIH